MTSFAPLRPEPFQAVGLWYQDFSQTTDDEVRDLLAQRQQHPRKARQCKVRLRPRAHRNGARECLPVGWSLPETTIRSWTDRRRTLRAARRSSHGTHEFYGERAEITEAAHQARKASRPSRSRPTGPTPIASTATCAA